MMNMKRKTSTGSGGAAMMHWPDSDNLNICVSVTHRRSIDCTRISQGRHNRTVGYDIMLITSVIMVQKKIP